MAWSWSCTVEGQNNARRNLSQLDQTTMGTILAEWKAAVFSENGPPRLHLPTYEAELRRLVKLPTDVLAAEIWDLASEQATCTNGHHEAWLCPFGCGPHMVPFDLQPGA